MKNLFSYGYYFKKFPLRGQILNKYKMSIYTLLSRIDIKIVDRSQTGILEVYEEELSQSLYGFRILSISQNCLKMNVKIDSNNT